jgi:tetratricopeptide (TPR) repeat protein
MSAFTSQIPLSFPFGASGVAQHLQFAASSYSNGQLQAAEHHYRAACTAQPGNRDAVLGLATVLIETGRAQAAIPFLQRVLAQTVADAPVHSALAVAFDSLGRYDDAIAHFESSLLLRPADQGTLLNFGNTLQKLNRAPEHIVWLERAIDSQNGSAPLYAMLARVQMGLGQLDAARQTIEQAIACAPRNAYYYRLLAEVKRFEPGDPHLAAMEALVRSTGG